jgi:hypothetical protein
MTNRRSFWLSLALINLCIVAFLGFTLRSKILFPLHFLDYGGLLEAHGHFAFAGWVGLALITLFIYDVLPEELSKRKIYQWILAANEVGALGMAFTFPFLGYNGISTIFSGLYMLGATLFVPVFIRDVLRTKAHSNVKLLSISSLISLLLSFIGVAGFMYMSITKSGNSILYRDANYTFLHFQYNGFFTLSVFALFLNYLVKKGRVLDKSARTFSIYLSLCIIPALFLALLWHNSTLFYVLALIGSFFILMSLAYLYFFLRTVPDAKLFGLRIVRTFLAFSVISFILKMLLQVGTIFPQLGDAVYGDRPVIIGFLHLVFLGFVTFFLLALLIENNFFTYKNKIALFPFIIFATGILLNEFLLMLQGLGILFNTNNDIFKWLLWGTAIVLFTGAVSIAASRFYVKRKIEKENKKAIL